MSMLSKQAKAKCSLIEATAIGFTLVDAFYCRVDLFLKKMIYAETLERIQ